MTDWMIEGAADWELVPLIDSLCERREQRHGIWTFWSGIVGSSRVTVARTDWGPINALAATLAGIAAFRPRAIVSQGMAGAHHEQLRPGDIVVAERTVDYSAFRSSREGGAAEPLHHRFRSPEGGFQEFRGGFPSDPGLISMFASQPNEHGRVWRGVAGSAYQYNRVKSDIQAIRERCGTDCEDMESAFAAGGAAIHNIPFVAVRMISNSEFVAPELDKRAGERCAAFVAAAIRNGRP